MAMAYAAAWFCFFLTFLNLIRIGLAAIRTSNAIERLHEEFKRRIKTQTVLPPELVEGAGNCRDVVLDRAGFRPDHDARKVDGWQCLAGMASDQIIDLAA